MDVAGILLIAVRGLHLAALLSAFGTLAFAVGVAPAALAAAPEQAAFVRAGLCRLARWSLCFGLGSGVAWFVLQASAIGGTAGIGDTLAVLTPVATDTQFGRTVLLRLLLLLAAFLLLGRADRLAAVLAGVALVLQGAIGHAGALQGAARAGMLGSEALHLLAAGAWLGALLPLLRCLAVLPTPAAAIACRRFSPIGMAAVLLLVGSGLVQGLELIGSVPGLVGTAYGQMALVKLVLFGLMLALAAHNRLTLTDRLATRQAAGARQWLRRSIVAETILAGLVVAAAAALASSQPAVHQQPVWPFSWQPSLAAMEDPDLRQEVAGALLLLGLGVAAVVASLVWRRGRLVAWIVLLAVFISRLPSFGLLLVEAYPTSFYASPTGFAAAGIVRGQVLFAVHCVACHGAGGAGDGPAAAGLRLRPADLTAPHLLDHPDGELFWWLSHGIDDPEGGLAMPGFSAALSEADRWALIDYLRANNAGATLHREGQWLQPLPAPALPIACADPAIADMAGLRGKAVQVIADGPGVPEPPAIAPQQGVAVITLHLGAAPNRRDCTAAASDAWQAYAVLSGVAPDALVGTAFMVDPDGWLRAVHRPGDAPGWNTPDRLIAELRAICANPISKPSGGGHDHHP